jgi:hypothetical protein
MEAGKGKVLGNSCLVTVLGFVESVGKVGVVDDVVILYLLNM